MSTTNNVITGTLLMSTFQLLVYFVDSAKRCKNILKTMVNIYYTVCMFLYYSGTAHTMSLMAETETIL